MKAYDNFFKLHQKNRKNALKVRRKTTQALPEETPDQKQLRMKKLTALVNGFGQPRRLDYASGGESVRRKIRLKGLTDRFSHRYNKAKNRICKNLYADRMSNDAFDRAVCQLIIGEG